MSYKPPIEFFHNDTLEDIASKIVKETDDRIVCEVNMQCGVNINKDEMIKALTYDRDQYNIGYLEGYTRGLQEGKVTAMTQLASSILEKYGGNEE